MGLVLLLRAVALGMLVGWVSCQGFVAPVCETISPCKCRFPWGSGFDLSNATLEVPISASDANGSSTVYFFNPCPPLPGQNNTCPGNAALCYGAVDGERNVLGIHANVTFGKIVIPIDDTTTTTTTTTPTPIGGKAKKAPKVKPPKPTVLQYVQYLYYDANNNTHNTTVVLKCAYGSPVTTLEEDPTHSGRLILNSKSACFTQVALPADEAGLSAGATFLVIFGSLFAAYLFGGMAIMKFIKGAQGVEIIPNYEFWASLPSLVKDGFLFAISGCRGAASYDRI